MVVKSYSATAAKEVVSIPERTGAFFLDAFHSIDVFGVHHRLGIALIYFLLAYEFFQLHMWFAGDINNFHAHLIRDPGFEQDKIFYFSIPLWIVIGIVWIVYASGSTRYLMQRSAKILTSFKEDYHIVRRFFQALFNHVAFAAFTVASVLDPVRFISETARDQYSYAVSGYVLLAGFSVAGMMYLLPLIIELFKPSARNEHMTAALNFGLQGGATSPYRTGSGTSNSPLM